MSAQRDQRVAIRALLAAGMNISEVVRQTGASRNTVAHVRDFGMERKEKEATRTVRTPDLVAQVEERVSANPNTTVRALAREMGASAMMMHHLVTEDLGMRSYAKQERPLLSKERPLLPGARGRSVPPFSSTVSSASMPASP